LSTGQAARYCLVTADTIANWIKRNKLPARRTVGGQYRILVQDLREFMVSQGMETDLLDAAHDERRYCWEFCQGAGVLPLLGVSCEDCLVRRTMALHCFELRSALSFSADDFEVCSTCKYLSEWRLEKGNGSADCWDSPLSEGAEAL
jgi:excisionase family DNA binding protein